MKIAILTTDNREHHRRYELTQPYFGTAPEALIQGFTDIPEVEVHIVSCTQRPMQSPEKTIDNIWFHSLHVPKIGWLRTAYQGCIRATKKLVRKLQPDIVHGQGTERDCAISAIFSGFPNVITLHGIMGAQARLLKARPGSFYWLAMMLERMTLPRTLGVLCNSAYTESMVRPLSRRTWQIPNAVRREFFDSPLPGRSTSATPVLLNVGAIGVRKRQLALLDIIGRLLQKRTDLELHFIGAADPHDTYSASFLRRVQGTATSQRIRHLGTRDLPELIRSFDHASALVHVPSEESFGLVVAEALARNLRLFATDVGGVRDIADGVEGAELFPVGNDDALAAAIGNWVQKGCPQPASAAAEMRRRYHPEVIAKRHVEIYHEVLSKPS